MDRKRFLWILTAIPVLLLLCSAGFLTVKSQFPYRRAAREYLRNNMVVSRIAGEDYKIRTGLRRFPLKDSPHFASCPSNTWVVCKVLGEQGALTAAISFRGQDNIEVVYAVMDGLNGEEIRLK